MKITITEMASSEQEITPEFCFEQAAKALLSPAYGNGQSTHVDVAREWRVLGETLLDATR